MNLVLADKPKVIKISIGYNRGIGISKNYKFRTNEVKRPYCGAISRAIFDTDFLRCKHCLNRLLYCAIHLK